MYYLKEKRGEKRVMDYKTARDICKNTYYPVCPEHEDKHEHCDRQTHTHEFTASTELELGGDLRHNHRFAGVTGEAIPSGNSHIHKIKVNTTLDLNHFHQVIVKTGPAITVNPHDPPGSRVHIHYVEDETTVNGRVPHDHDVEFVTLTAPNPPVH